MDNAQQLAAFQSATETEQLKLYAQALAELDTARRQSKDWESAATHAQERLAIDGKLLDQARDAISEAMEGVEDWEENAGFWWTCAARAIRSLRAELEGADAVIAADRDVNLDDDPEPGILAKIFTDLMGNTKGMDVTEFGVPVIPTAAEIEARLRRGRGQYPPANEEPSNG